MTKCVFYTSQLFCSTPVKLLCTELNDVNFTYRTQESSFAKRINSTDGRFMMKTLDFLVYIKCDIRILLF